jgi:hypothetical protein
MSSLMCVVDVSSGVGMVPGLATTYSTEFCYNIFETKILSSTL